MAVAETRDSEARFALLLVTDAEFRDAWNELLEDPSFQRAYAAIGEGGQATLRAGWLNVWETVHGPLANMTQSHSC